MEHKEQENTGHDIYTDPALVRSEERDPFFDYLLKNWRQLLVVAVVVFGFYYVYTRYEQTQVESRIASADLFIKVQESARELASAEDSIARLTLSAKDKEPSEVATEKERLEKNLAEAREKFNQRLSALSDGRAPYVYLGDIYRGLNALRVGDTASARTTLGQVITALDSKTDQGSEFITEMAKFSLAKALVDESSSYSEGREMLQKLATAGKYFNAAAALTLARVSSSDEEKGQALTIMQELTLKYPEQSDLLAEEIERLS